MTKLIEYVPWADFVFNPFWGCERLSNTCDNCYISTIKQVNKSGIKNSVSILKFKKPHWNLPKKWNRLAAATGRRFRIACSVIGDVFTSIKGAKSEREKLWKLIAQTPYLDWFVMTKNITLTHNELPVNMPDNLWIGVSPPVGSVRDYINYMSEISKLKKTFAIIEPLGRYVDLTSQLTGGSRIMCPQCGRLHIDEEGTDPHTNHTCHSCRHSFDSITPILGTGYDRQKISWLIIGGAVKPHRQIEYQTAFESHIQLCARLNVPIYVSRAGTNLIKNDNTTATFNHPLGADMSEWPESMRVRQFPTT